MRLSCCALRCCGALLLRSPVNLLSIEQRKTSTGPFGPVEDEAANGDIGKVKYELKFGFTIERQGASPAEFGWSDRWAQQLMQVADRFSNAKSTSVLPSSAQVLALLAVTQAGPVRL